MLLICLGMVMPRVATRWTLCSSRSFAARCMHDVSIEAGIWHLQKGSVTLSSRCFSLIVFQEGSMGAQLWACDPCSHFGKPNLPCTAL